MDLSYLFGLIAGLVALLAYGTYFSQIIRGKSTPNASTWGIWLLLSVINTFTYFLVTNGNIWQSLIVFAVTFATAVIFIYSAIRGKFSKVTRIEVLVFILALAIGIFWQTTSNFRISNLLLQVIYLISIIPTVTGVIRGTGKEHYVAWVIAFIAYMFSTASIYFAPDVDWIAFVYPIVNGLMTNGIVIVSIFYKKHKN